MLFNYNSGLKDTFIRGGSYLPGQIAKAGWKQVLSLNTNEAIEFGQVVKRDVSGAVPFAVALEASDTAADVYGIAVRDVQSQGQVNYGVFTKSFINSYNPGQPVSIMRKGFITVPVQNGTPTVGGTVYVRVTASSGNTYLPIGGIETAADEGKCVAIKATFESGALFPMNGVTTAPSSSVPTSATAVIYLDLE